TLVTIPSDQIIVNIEQNRSPTIADYHERPFPHDHELENVKDEEDDEGGFHIVHRRKRIPSSTAHAKALPSSTTTTESTLSSDIDLEPVILHGHPAVPTVTSPIVSETTNIPSKTKHKKKKKEKSEVVFFDAPELISSDPNKQKIDVTQAELLQQGLPVNIETLDSSRINEIIKQECVQSQSASSEISNEKDQPEVLSTVTTSSTNKLEQKADNENEITSSDVSQLSSTPVRIVSEEEKVDMQSIEQQPIDKQAIMWSSATSEMTTRASADTELVSQSAREEEEQEDNEGFQVVHHHKHITSAPRSRKIQQSSSTTNTIYGQNISPDIDLKPVVIHGRNDSASRSIPRTTAINETASTSTSQFAKSGDKLLTSNITDNEVVISRPSEEIVPELEVAVQEQSSIIGLFEIMKDIVSAVPQKIIVSLEPTDKTTHSANTSSSVEEHTPADVPRSGEEITSTIKTTIVTSEGIRAKEEQQLSSTGLFHRVKNLLPATSLPNTSSETTSEAIQQIVKSQQQEDTTEEFVDANDSSTVQNLLSISPNLMTNAARKQDYPTKDRPIPAEEERHTVFDLVVQAVPEVKEIISNLGSTQEGPDLLQASSNLLDKSLINTLECGNLYNDKEQQTFIATVKEVVEAPQKNISPIQEQKIPIPEHSLISTYPSDSYTFQNTDPKRDTLSSGTKTSPEHYKQQTEIINKPSNEKLQLIYDDYPWYSSYYTIADAEAKLGTFYIRLYSFNEQNRSLTTVDVHQKHCTNDHELQNGKDIPDNDDGFHVVHRRKRTPSSTTHTKTLPSTTITMESTLSSDIDLEPVIIHGHPTAPTISSPIVSETANIPSKTKHKKKKKDKTEMIFFDAPELTSPDAKKEKIHDTQSTLVEQEHSVNIETMDSSQLHQTIASAYEPLHSTSTEISNEQKQPEVLSALITSNIDELKPVADNKNELISNDVSVVPSTLVTMSSDEIIVNTEQNRSPATADFHETPSTDDRELENIKNEDDDEEGFHIVHRRKRIPSSTTHAKTLPSTAITTESTLSADIDLEPVIIHGHPTAPTISSPIVSETTNISSKTKHKKKKKDKTEMIFFDAPELTSPDAKKEKIHDKQSALVEQEHPVNIETMDSSQRTQRIASEYEQLEPTSTERSNEQQPEVLSTLTASNIDELKLVADNKNELTSNDVSPLSSTLVTIPSDQITSNTETSERQSIDKEPVQQSSPPFTTTDISSIQKIPIDDHKQQDDTTSKPLYQDLQAPYDDYQLHPTCYSIADAETKLAESNQQLNLVNEQNRSPSIADFHETPSTDDRELESVKDEDNDDGTFHIVRRRKRIPSSTTHAQTLPSTAITMESTLSADIDLEPVILHGHPTSPIIISPIVSETTNIASKTKHKKRKKEKAEIILFDAPELIPSDVNKQKSHTEQSDLVEQERSVNIETMECPHVSQGITGAYEQLESRSTEISNEQHQPEVLSTLITSNIEKSKQATDRENEVASSHVSQSFSSPHTQVAEEGKVGTQSVEHQQIDKKSALPYPSSPITSTTASNDTKVVPQSTVAEEEQEDNEGFQLVHHCKHGTSAPRSRKAPQSSSFTNIIDGQNIGPDIDVKPVIIHGRHDSASRTIPGTTAISENPSTWTSQSAMSGDKVLTSNVRDKEVVVSKPFEELVTKVEVTFEEKSSITDLSGIMKDVLSAVIETKGTPSSDVEAQSSLIDETIEQEGSSDQVNYATLLECKDTPTSTNTLVSLEPTEEIAHRVNTSSLVDEQFRSEVTRPLEEISSTSKPTIITSEGMKTNENNEQQQLSSVELFDNMKSLLPSRLLSNTSNETIPESIQSTVKSQQQEGTAEQFVDANDSSTVFIEPTSILYDTTSIIQNVLSISSIPSTDAIRKEDYPMKDRKIEVCETASPTTTKEKHDGVFDPVARALSNVKQTISDLRSSIERTILSDSSSNLTDKPLDNIQQSDDSLNDESKQTFIGTIENTHEKIVPTQDRTIRITEQSLISTYPSHSHQIQNTDTEHHYLPSSHQISMEDHKQKDEFAKKPSHEKDQILHDDYPWYSSYYSIADAETRNTGLLQQLNPVTEENRSSTIIGLHETLYIHDSEIEYENDENDDDEGFHTVHRRKRIPSSTTHTETTLSTIITARPPISSDIDLEPVILHGHPTAPVVVSSIVPQAINVPSKTKYKKKKKEKPEMIFFDAPELISPDSDKQTRDAAQSELVEQKRSVDIEIADSSAIHHTIKHECEQLHPISTEICNKQQQPEVLSTLITSNIDELRQVADKKDTQIIEQQSIDKELIQPSSLSSTMAATTSTHTKVISQSAAEEEELEDNEGFQVVHHHKHITSAPRSQKTQQSSSTTNTIYGQNISPDIDLKPVVIHGRHDSASRSISRTPSINKTPSTSTSQSSKSNDKVLASIVTDNEVVISRHPEEIVTEVEASHEQQSSSTGLSEIMKDVLSPLAQTRTSPPSNIVDNAAWFETNDTPTSTSTVLTSEPTHEATHSVNITSSVEEQLLHQCISTTDSTIIRPEEIKPNEDYHEQQLSSTGLFDTKKSILPSTLLSNASNETSLEIIQSVVKAQQQEHTAEQFFDATDSSSIFAKPISFLDYTLPNDQSILPVSSDSTTSFGHRSKDTAIDEPIETEEKHHGVFDLVVRAISNVKETLSNLSSSDAKHALLESPSNLSDQPQDSTQQPDYAHNNKEKQTFIGTIKEVAENVLEKIVPTQEQLTQIIEQSEISNYPSLLNQYQATDNNSDRLSSSHQTLTDDHIHKNKFVNKPSYQKLQVFYDDYPWYSNTYTIADAETKIARLYKQLNVVTDENRSSTVVDLHETPSTHDHELENEKDEDDDEEGFHTVHRRKRIPSSTTHAKTLPSTIMTTNSSMSPDIDLEPVILHGHPTDPTITSPIVSETTNIPSKTKHKKKKKEKPEMLFFNAPELILTDTSKQKSDTAQSELVEQKRSVKIETADSSEINQTIKHECEQLQSTSTEISHKQQPEVLSTLVTVNTDKLKHIYDKENNVTSDDVSQLSSTPVTIVSDERKVVTQSTEQQPIDKQSIPYFSTASIMPTTTSTHTKAISQSAAVETEEEEDNEGFQVVHNHKHITSAPRSRKPQQSSSTTNAIYGQNISPDIDLKPVVIHGRHDSASRSIPRTTAINETASTSISQSAMPGNKILTSNVTENDVFIARTSDEIVTEVEAAHQEQSSFAGLSKIVKEVLSPVPRKKIAHASHVEEQSRIIDQTVEEKTSSHECDYSTLHGTSSTSTLSSTLLTSKPTEEATHFVHTSSLIEQQIPSHFTTPIKDVISTTEKMAQNENNEQQNVLSTGLFDKVQSLLPSTLASKTAHETSSETIPSVLNAQQHDDTAVQFIDVHNSSSVVTQSKSVLDVTIPNDQSILLVSSISSSNTDHQEDSSTKDEPKTTEEKQHGIFDLVVQAISNVKETISNIGSSADNHQTLTDDDKQQDKFVNKHPYEKLQVINDDYRWYSNYYPIADAEAKIAQLYKQLNVVTEENRSSTVVDLHETLCTDDHELKNEKDEDDDEEGFHTVHRRKRIPSSTTHTETTLSTIITARPPISSDIDLEPVILHGHPIVPVVTAPIMPQSVDITSKTKHKKKKKEKSELIFFDAPELVSSDANKEKVDAVQSQLVEQEYPKKIETMNSYEIKQTINNEFGQLHPISTVLSDDQKTPEVLSTLIISCTDELRQVADKNDTQTVEQQSIDKELIQPSSPSSTTATTTSTHTKVISQSAAEEEELEDSEGFQIVHHHKHITTAPRSRKTQQSSSTTNVIYGQNISPDIDLKPVVIHGRHDSASRSIPRTPTINETVSTSTSQSAMSGDKVLTSHVTENDVVIARTSDEIVPEVEAVHQEQSSFAGLSKIVKEVLSPMIQTKTTSSSHVEEQSRIISRTIEEKSLSNLVDSATSFGTNDISTLTSTSSTSQPIEETSHTVMNISLIETEIPSEVTASLKDVTPTTELTIVTSEEMKTNEDNEQELSLAGLLNGVKNLLSPTFISRTSNETSTENIQPIITSQQQENTTEQLVDANDSSSVSTKPTSVLDDTLQTDQSILSISNISSADTDHQQNYPTTDKSIKTEEKQHSVLDLVVEALSNVKETISSIGTSDEKTVLRESSSNLSDKSMINTLESDDLDDKKEKQTFIESIEEIVDNTNITILPKQEKVTPITKQFIISHYSSDSNQFEATDTERDHHSSTYQTLTDDNKQHDLFANKLSYDKLQVIHDDYPWYSSHYTIADAEARIVQLYKRLNLVNEQNHSSTKVEFHETLITHDHELQKEKDKDDDNDESHIVQHPKHIPSSTTHTKTLITSSTPTTVLPISSDVDFEPVILHEHPTAPVVTSSVVSQTINIASKTKHKKKKKKGKKETILFDVPESISSDANKPKNDTLQSELVEQMCPKKMETIDSSQITIISHEQQKPEVLPTLINSNTDKLKQKANKKKKSTSNDVATLLPTPVTIVSGEEKTNTQTIKQQAIDKKTILRSSSSSTAIITPTIRTKVTSLPQEEEEEQDDNAGFQLVHYHKRILSVTKSEKTLPPPITTSKEIFSSDLNLKISLSHEQKNLPTSTTDVTQSTTSKKSKNKHKRQKKEIVSSSNVEQQTIHKETIIQSPILSSFLIEDSNVQSKPTVPSITKATKVLTKTLPSSEEEDNEGFQVVHYRKHITSAIRTRKAPQSSSKTKTVYEQNISRHIDPKSVAIQGRHDSTSRSIPHTIATSKTSSDKQQKDQAFIINTQPRLASTEMHLITSTNIDNSFEMPKVMKKLESKPDQCQQHVKDSKYETISSLKPKSDQSSSEEQPIKLIVKEYHMSTKPDIKTTNEKSSTDKIIPSTVLHTSSINIQKSKIIEDDNDNDGFQIVRHHKHKTSTITKQSKLTSTIDQKTTNTYVKQDSFTSTNAKQKSKKLKPTNEHTLSSLIIDNDFSPLAIEETQDQTTNENIRQTPELKIRVSKNFFSNSNETISSTKTYETKTSQINKHIHSIDNTQNQLQSRISNQELSTSSNKLPHKVNDRLKTESIKSIGLSQTSSTDMLSTPTTNINNEQNKTISNEKVLKRKKKKLHTETKIDDKSLLTSSTSTILTTHKNIESDNDKQKSKTTVTPSITSLPDDTSEILSIKEHKSQEIKTNIPETISLTSSKIETTEFLTSPTSKSIHLIQDQVSYEETPSKLDLFLPEYMRQQIETYPESSSSIVNSDFTSNTTSFDIIQNKQQQSKMFKKNLETKILLTNKFDNTNKQHKSQRNLSDSENMNDDDEFIIQTFHSNLPNASQEKSTNISIEQNIDNILSRGFHHWLEESQALSQQQDTSSSVCSLTHAMQSIIIQPIESDEDDSSYIESQTIEPTYIIGVRPEKRIHIHNAYSINHPESISSSSYFITQSNNKTFEDDSRKYNSDNEEDSMNDTSKKQHSNQTDTKSLTKEKQQSNSINDNHLQISFTIDDVQRCLGEDFYHQMDNNNNNNNISNNNNHSINYDDWAYFLEHKNSYHIGYDLSTSLECFYAQTCEDDTFLSNTIPIHYSIQREKQRYGDFLTLNNDKITPQSMIKLSSYSSKPSESFQRWKKHKSISNQYQNDDEIFISHSTNGLCRQVTP
ncbi:unnamed protein product, partial [Rotaria sp. Silwood2]